jgi:hypothetical protein
MLFLEGRALHIIYCYADKAPIGRHGWYSAVADAESIAKLKTGPNTGVATGAINGIVIVDVDPRHAGDTSFTEHLSWLPPTRTHRTRGGGLHLIFKYPPQGIRNFQGRPGRLPGIDILADGKGVLWPPSSGYTVLDDRPMTDCPDRLRELVGTLSTTPRTPSPRRGEDGPPMCPTTAGGPVFRELPKALYFRVRELVPLSDIVTRHHWRRVEGMLRCVVYGDEGNHNAVLNWAAYWIARDLIPVGILTRENAETLLTQAASGYAKRDGMQAAWRTIQSGLRAGLRDATRRTGGPSPLRKERGRVRLVSQGCRP